MITLKQPAGGLSRFVQKVGQDVEKAARKALTRTALLARDAVKEEMARVFDRPTRYALGSVYARGAGMQDPQATIWLKDGLAAGKGTPATKYMAAQIEGGPRGDKRSERALRLAGILPAGMQTVPGSAAPLDAHGNIPGPYLVAMLSYLRAMDERGYMGNRTNAKRRGKFRKVEWFVIRDGQQSGSGARLPPGVYLNDARAGKARRGNNAAPVLLFVKTPNYRQRLDFHGVVERVVGVRLIGEIREAVRLGRGYNPRTGGAAG